MSGSVHMKTICYTNRINTIKLGKFIIRNEKLEFSTTPLIVSQRIPRRLARDWKEEYALRLQLMRYSYLLMDVMNSPLKSIPVLYSRIN
jgi:hypothetical protein